MHSTELNVFLTECHAKVTTLQSAKEETFMQSEQSHAFEPPAKKKKRKSKKHDIKSPQHAMANLAAQLQLDHFRQVRITLN